MKPTDFSYHLTRYLSIYLPGIQGLSGNTIASRRDTFTLLLGFCKDTKSIPIEKVKIQTLTLELITDFLHWLEDNRGCRASTRNQRLASIKAFFKYLQLKAPEHILLCQQIMSIPLKKTDTGNIGYLSLDGIKAILNCIDINSGKGYRNLVLLSVLYDSGARVQEIADLKVGDIRLTKPETIKLTGKGRKTRIVPIMEPTVKLISGYLKKNSLYDDRHKQYPLFFNRSGRKLTRAGISYVVKKVCRICQRIKTVLDP